jgi:xanthosine utilization system XapX-like protein
MNKPEPSPHDVPPDAAITSQRPLAADTGITRERPIPNMGNTPDTVRSLAFLSRLKILLQIYADIRARHPKPPMWGLLQGGAIIMGIVVGYTLIEPTVVATGKEHLGGLVFLASFFGAALVPDLLLKLLRRSQVALVRQRLEEAARLTVQTYPDEIEQCGGVRVLTDPVELEALVHVLENTYHPPPQPDKERWWTNKQ